MTHIERYTRELKDEKEFKKLKGYIPFSDQRQLSKILNFSMLFGASYKKFSESALELQWTEDQVNDYIEKQQLYDLKAELKEKHDSSPLIGYYTCAYKIRENFFSLYKGLMERIERNRAFASDNGYIRTLHGAIRRLPLLFLKGKDEDMREFAGYLNIAVNTDIQSLEACVVMKAIAQFHNWLKDNKMKSRIFGTVHDSVDLYLHRDELNIMIPKIYEMFESREKWQNGIPLTIELKISDPKKGELYKEGIEGTDYLKQLEKEHG